MLSLSRVDLIRIVLARRMRHINRDDHIRLLLLQPHKREQDAREVRRLAPRYPIGRGVLRGEQRVGRCLGAGICVRRLRRAIGYSNP